MVAGGNAVRFYWSIRRATVSLLGALLLLFLAAFLDAMADGPFWTHPATLLLSPPPAILGSALIARSLVELFDRRPVLILDRQGLSSSQTGDTAVPWSEITGLSLVWTRRPFRRRTTLLAVTVRDPAMLGPGRRRAVSAAWDAVWRADAYLPLDRLSGGRAAVEAALARLQPGRLVGAAAMDRIAFAWSYPKLLAFASLLVITLGIPALIGYAIVDKGGARDAVFALFVLVFGAVNGFFVWFLLSRLGDDRPAIGFGPDGLFYPRRMHAPLPWNEIRSAERMVVPNTRGPDNVFIGLLLVDPAHHPDLCRRRHPWLAQSPGKFHAILHVNFIEQNGKRGLFEVLTRFHKRYGPLPGGASAPASSSSSRNST